MSNGILKENVLPDDYIVYADFYYVADDKVVISDWHEVTIKEFKARIGAQEIKNCDIAGRGLM